ncbi:MAG: translocation/assembly module TamB domain-containing protein [Opitutaceae bacterium]
MRRFIFRLIVGSLLGVSLILLAYPVWLPWALVQAGPRFGLAVGSFDRLGYRYLLLEDVRLEQPGVRLIAGKVSLPIWPVWLLASPEPGGRAALVRIEQWHLEISASTAAEPAAASSVADIHRQIRAVLPDLQRFLPTILAESGTLVAGGQTVFLERVEWRFPGLEAVVVDPGGLWRSRARITAPVADPWTVDLTVEPWDASVTALITGASEQLEVSLGLQWQKSAFSGRVVFAAGGMLPDSALIQSDLLEVDPQMLGIDDYGPIRGKLDLSWSGNRFSASADLSSTPESQADPDLPPLKVALEADGDLESVHLETVELDLPWATARLSSPIDLRFGPGFLDQTADLSFGIDLAASPFPASGRAAGQARLTTRAGRMPTLTATLSAEDLAMDGFSGVRAEAEIALDYPRLSLPRLSLALDPDSELTFSGEVDLAKKTLDGEVLARTQGELLKSFLGDDIDVSDLVVAGSLNGPWEAPDYSLSGRAGLVRVPGMLPSSIDGRFRGCGLDLDHAGLTIRTDQAELEITGGLSAGSAMRARLTGLRLSVNGATVLESARGALIETDLKSWVGGTIRLEGEDRFLDLRGDLDWPFSGQWVIDAENLNSRLADGLLDREFDWLDVEAFHFEGSWMDGPVVFAASSSGGLVSDQGPIAYRFKVSGDESWLSIEDLVVASDGADVLEVRGRLPGLLTPGGERLVSVDWDRSVDLAAQTAPNPDFWDRIARMVGIDLTEPKLNLLLEGPAAAPIGRLELNTARVSLLKDGQATTWPPITGIRLIAQLTPDRVILETSRLQVEGEALSVEGELPLRRGDWLKIALEQEWPDLSQATLRFRADDARIRAFARFLPRVLAPTGQLDLDLTMKPGRQFSGYLELDDAALRPLRPFGTMQEIHARVDFSGRSIICNEIAAIIGGQKVILTGRFDWDGAGEVDYDLALKGTKVPLVREPGLVVRSDLDLRLRGAGMGAATLTGTLGLSDSLYVADLNSFLSGSVDSPSRRPPYFSVEAEPFAQWKLDLKVAGPKFLRVETPVFKGLLSADFALTGTLREPKALGELQVDSGTVEFPFATLKMTSGSLSILEDNPFDILLDLEAGSRIFGFDIGMRVEGYASAPRLFFESEPNLGSDAVLLMLTTGEVPSRSGYYSMQQRMTKLAVYLGRNLLVEFGIGGGSEGRFLIESGSDISLKGRETYNVEVLLNDDWSLVGGYDEFDAYNGGVKWRVYSK